MKHLIVLVFCLSGAYSFAEKFKCVDLSKDIYKSSKLEFIQHTSKTKYGSYLAMNIAYGPVKSVFDQLQKNTGLMLTNRGEAHITVVTPPEFSQQLANFISIKEIHQIAKKMKIQDSQFEVVCLGSAKVGKDTTYYLIVESQDLINIRKAIFEKFVSKGGDPNIFEPESFYPHITVGFKTRDLHESDGVIKNKKTCVKEINFTN